MTVQEDILRYVADARQEMSLALSVTDVDNVRVKYLGKKGLVSTILRRMGEVAPEDRPLVGRLANDARAEIETVIMTRLRDLERQERDALLLSERVDVTLPGRVHPKGNLHLLQKVYNEIERIFLGLGFEVAEGPEVELDFYNFVALNIPKDHPARDMQATFYFDEDVVLRTQTSPVQIRAMLQKKGAIPLRLISPGRVYRRDSDATHSPMFTQFEGLAVDTNVTVGDLKGTLQAFASAVFDPSVKTRLRPSYFPFTEPSFEVDVSCTVCHGQGCRVCKNSGWLEILGSGMVHPNVLRNGGYDPEKVTGFAFGMGVERITMLKYRLDDMRNLFYNDVRFLRQF